MDGKIIPISEANRTKLNKPLKTDSVPILRLSQDGPGMKRVAEILTGMFQVMNTFGRTPNALKAIIPSFLTDLAEYPIEALELAFRSWRQDNSAFPTPHDILNILRFDPDESVLDPCGYAGWFVKRGSLKPGDEGYIKPPAFAGEISRAIRARKGLQGPAQIGHHDNGCGE